VVSALILVVCVKRHSVELAVLLHINGYIVVFALILVHCVIKLSVVIAI